MQKLSYQQEADYGYCAAKREYYYGFKLGLRVTPIGMIVNYPLLPARPHDVQFLETLVEGSQGIIIGDKGFLSEQKSQQLLTEGVQVVTPPRRNMMCSNAWNSTYAHFRKVVETVGAQLTQPFG